MRRFRILGLCLVATAAISIVGVSAAIAAPEYFTENTKTHVLEKLSKTDSFTSKGVASKLEGGVVIECESDTSKGLITSRDHNRKTQGHVLGMLSRRRSPRAARRLRRNRA